MQAALTKALRVERIWPPRTRPANVYLCGLVALCGFVCWCRSGPSHPDKPERAKATTSPRVSCRLDRCVAIAEGKTVATEPIGSSCLFVSWDHPGIGLLTNLDRLVAFG